jgi:Recombination endonuclease VII
MVSAEPVTMNQFIPANLIEIGQQPQNPQERAKAKRLYKAYRWTWAMYWALGVKQGWKCAICGRTAKNAPLNVDHEHFKIHVGRNGSGLWEASTMVAGRFIVGPPRKFKKEAVDEIWEAAIPLSVRGLLCPGRHRGCNRLLGRVDSPEWLAAALEYVKNPPAKDLDILSKV